MLNMPAYKIFILISAYMTYQIHDNAIVTSQSTREFLYKICRHVHNFSAFNTF